MAESPNRMYSYDKDFYRYINKGSSKSAHLVIPHIQALIPDPLRSVLDVGCGAGAWLEVWASAGCEITGVDGPYVEEASLLIAPDKFQAHNLNDGFDLGIKFDLAQCLEVAEHLPTESSKQLVASLCHHSDIVLFSAAAPGQGGENHVNEQYYQYWRDLFLEQGFQLYDAVRPRLSGQSSIEPWYRYNSFLYVRQGTNQRCHTSLRAYAVDPATNPKDVSPVGYRIRKTLVRMLPQALSTKLAIAKKTILNFFE